MSVSFLASGWNPESSYCDSSPDRDHLTPGPSEQQETEYTPTRRSTQGSTWTTPSQRSHTASISSGAREALDRLYKSVYGEDSLRCLVTQSNQSLNISHVVRRGSTTDELMLYEYCLGLALRTFHVDSRRNLLYLEAGLHLSFDARKWLLLPDLVVLQNVHNFVQGVIDARKDPTRPQIHTFRSKWHMKTKTRYTFLPLPGYQPVPFFRRILNPAENWQPHSYPYQTVPSLECHIAPPFAVINAGPKCAGLDLVAVARAYCQTNETQQALQGRLELLCETWNLFENARGDAKDWGNEKKRKREHEDEDIERLTQSSKRTTRSKTRSSGGSAGRKREVRFRGSGTNTEQGEASGSRKRNWTHSSSGGTLSEHAVFLLGKRQKIPDLNSMVKRWVESAYSTSVYTYST